MAFLPVIAAVASIAGTGLAAVGAIQQGNAARAAATYNAAVAENNAIVARQNAKLALSESNAEEQGVRRRTAQQLGTAGAAIGASGITQEGSALDVLEETVALGELDALTVRWQGDLKARNFEQQARGYQSSAELERMSGRAAKTNSIFSAAGTLLSGLSSTSSNYFKSTNGTALRLG
jgi:hypothetical protein